MQLITSCRRAAFAFKGEASRLSRADVPTTVRAALARGLAALVFLTQPRFQIRRLG